MKKIALFLAAVAASVMMFSCASTTKGDAFPKMYDEKPEVMVIMPPINNSTNVEAKDYFYTTLNVPLAEAGYYVLPPAAVYSTLQRESAYDSERFIDGDLKKFNQLFGADVAIFTVIKSWNKSVIGSSITIEIEYIFKSTKTNEVLYNRDATIVCDTSSGTKVSGFGLVGSLINMTADAVSTAVADYVKVAVKCNNSALTDIPAGKYSPKFGADAQEGAMAAKIRLSTSK